MRRISGLITLILLLAACGEQTAEPEDPAALFDREIARLEQVAAGIDRGSLSDSAARRLDEHLDDLRSLRSSSLPLRLHSLRDPFVGIETTAFLTAHRDDGQSIEALENLWKQQRNLFEDELAPESDGSLMWGLVEVADTRSKRLFHASLQYGRIASPGAGLFYLAQAEGNRRYEEFVKTLDRTAGETPPEPATLLSVADAIESEALAAFNDDPTSRRMIPVSVRLDEARELIDEGKLAGATLMLAEARLELNRSPSNDLVPLFAELKGGRSAGPIPGGRRPSGESTVIDAGEESAQSRSRASSGNRAGGPTPNEVTLTLVRWPYT